MDGLNFKAPSGLIDKYFTIDQYGLVCPSPSMLQMDVAADRVTRLLNSNTDCEFKLTERYYLTDVETTDNWYGNTNAIGAGVHIIGTQPLKKVKFKGRIELHSGGGESINRQLANRERKIENYQHEVDANLANDDSVEMTERNRVLKDIEHDQARTGGGFDGNKIGDIHNTAMQGMLKSIALPEIANSTVSEKFVESCIEFRDYLISQGLRLGSLQPDGLSKVRFEQDNDGMFGFPVMKKGGAPLDRDIATRLLIDSGVDTRPFVDSLVHDSNSNKDYPYRVQDALGYILDHGTFSARDLTSIVIFLARIQKHGWKEEEGKLVAKPGKARAVFPNSAVQAAIEGMPINAYNNALQALPVRCFTSLQTKETRVNIIKEWMQANSAKGYGFLAADWSQYDATVPGWGLATVIQYCVKPFFKAQYYNWLDAVTFILTYKYFLLDEDLARINAENYSECLSKVPNVEAKRFRVFGLWNYLISGAKFTHVGGSEYGICSIHLTIPKLLGFKGIIGQQAGDDTLMGVPLEMIHLDSKEDTYEPIASAAKSLGLDINPSKQIFYSTMGELVGIFLQDSYHEKAEIWGVGSIYRPLSAVFYSERNRGLSPAEQFMAEISRMNQGYDNPFVDKAVEFWLNHEPFIGTLVKEKGAENAFQFLVETSGYSIDEIAQRIQVGSFSYSIGKDQLRTGKIPILAVMDRVASKMSFNVNLDKVLNLLGVAGADTSDAADSFPTGDEEDILDD